MEKTLHSEYQKCFDILNTQSLIERETYKNFADELFEIAKKQLGCFDTKLKFVDELQNNLGFASIVDNSVTLNLSKMEKHTLYKTVSTIYHELTHISQDRTDLKKKIDTVLPAEFPFVRFVGNDKFLPAEILGISPFLFYYTCKHEKQARDAGSKYAMDLFAALKDIAQTSQTKNGTIRLIERCIQQVQTRWDKENADNEFATLQIKMFLKQNPNFVKDAFEKIKQEFCSDIVKYGIYSRERLQCENRFNFRVGALVLLGCDESLKKEILDFATTNFVNKNEVFTLLISVIDSPYSKTTKNELGLLFQLAKQVGCSKDTLLNLLTSWDKNYVNQVINDLSLQNTKHNDLEF